MGTKKTKKTKNKKLPGRFLKSSWSWLVLFCAIAAMTAGCANDDQIKADINNLQNQTYILQNQIASMKSNVQSSQQKLSSSNETELHTIRSSQAGVVDQLSNLQSDLNGLRGSVEEQKHMDQKLFSDQSHETAALATRIEQQQKMIDAQGNQLSQLETKFQAQAAQTKAAQAAQAQEQQQAAQTPQAVYDTAYGDYQNGNFNYAIKVFTSFLQKFPDDPLAGNAQFWIGEAYFKQMDYDQAILAYEKVVKNYPKSLKAPSALLQQGISFTKTKGPDDKKVAAALFKQVIEKYPDSPEAKTAKSLLKTGNGKTDTKVKKKKKKSKYKRRRRHY